MNNEITREGRAIAWLIVFSIVMVAVGFLIMALSTAGVLGYTPQPASDPVEPDPWVSGNITKDSHESAWSLVQYEDDYGDVQTLPGFAANAVYLNYSEIHGHKTYEIGGSNWSDPDDWTAGLCSMNNEAITATTNGISFYAEPDGISSCGWSLYPAEYVSVNYKKDRLIVGAYFDLIGGGLGQRTTIGIYDEDLLYAAEYGADWMFSSGTENSYTTFVADKNRTAIFKSQIIGDIGDSNPQPEELGYFYVLLDSDNAANTDPMRVEITFFEVESTIYQVGYSPTGQKRYNQTQADNNTVELGSLSVGFDYTSIDNLKVRYKQHASDLPEAYVEVSRSQSLSTYRFSYPQPEVISLHYDDVVLRDKLNQPGSVFTEVKLNGQDISIRYEPLSKGAEIVLLEGIQEGEQPAIYFETSYSSDEWDGITKGGGGWWDFGGGFITPQLMAPFVALGILVAILAVVLIQKFKKSREERPAGEESGRGVEVEVSVRGLAKDENAILMEGRELLHWLIIGAIVVLIIFTVLAMLRSIPIIWGWIGPVGLSALLPAGYFTWNNEAAAEALAKSTTGFQLDFVSDTLDAFVQGLIDIFNAIVNAIVSIINVIATVIGTFIELIVLPPARFVGGSFDAATDMLVGLGISAPLAMIIVTVSVGVVIATVGVFVYKQLTAWED